MYILVSSIGFLVAILLFSFRQKEDRSNFWLAFYFIGVSSTALITHGMFVKEYQWIMYSMFPYVFLFTQNNGVFLYFYFLKKLKPGFKVQNKMFLHFIPAGIMFLNASPYIFLNSHIKNALLPGIYINTVEGLNKFPYFFFPYYWSANVRPLLALVYLIVCIYLFAKATRKRQLGHLSANESLFLKLIIGLNLVHYVLNAITIFIFLSSTNGNFQNRNYYLELGIWPQAVVVSLMVVTFFFPKIIFQKIYFGIQKGEKLKSLSPLKEESPSIPQYDLDMIEKIVVPYLENLPFLKPGFSLYQFAEETKLPSHQLSYFLKVKYDQSFNDFKNYHRVRYAISQIDSGIAKNHTLETISLNCGFRSRTNFVDAFKKVTGKTPSDYLKK